MNTGGRKLTQVRVDSEGDPNTEERQREREDDRNGGKGCKNGWGQMRKEGGRGSGMVISLRVWYS